MVKTETRRVESNGWVESGEWHVAYFPHQPEFIRGCPSGRSQRSAVDAVRDLLSRTNDESGTALTLADIECLG
jgi:hypothetical protein